MTLKQLELEAVVETLKRVGWVQADAAEVLGISERVMSYKVRRLGIDVRRGTYPIETIYSAPCAPCDAAVCDAPYEPDVPSDDPRLTQISGLCPLCDSSDWMQIDPYGHPKVSVCMRPPCIYKRAANQSRVLVPVERAIA